MLRGLPRGNLLKPVTSFTIFSDAGSNSFCKAADRSISNSLLYIRSKIVLCILQIRCHNILQKLTCQYKFTVLPCNKFTKSNWILNLKRIFPSYIQWFIPKKVLPNLCSRIFMRYLMSNWTLRFGICWLKTHKIRLAITKWPFQ